MFILALVKSCTVGLRLGEGAAGSTLVGALM